MFKKLRIAVLALVLVNVAVGTWLTRVRTTAWTTPLRVAVFPVAADASPATAGYIARLDRERLAPIEAFFREEAARHGLPLAAPVEVRPRPRVAELPPQPPFGERGMAVILWSLKMRWYAWRNGGTDGPKPHVRLFVLFHDPQLRTNAGHSLGLQRGMVGVVNAFADDGLEGRNAVVIAHELLHTVGATDKYDPATNQPAYPDGYAEPGREPLLPQAFAELMAGRVPRTREQADMPASLAEVLVGPRTAAEIGWTAARGR